MIQRIQSVFLGLAFIAGLLLFIYPVAWYYGPEYIIEFYVFKLKDHVPGNEALFTPSFLLPLTILVVVVIAMSLVTLFMYKSLKKQLKLARICVFMSIALIAALFFFYSDTIARQVGINADYEFGVFLPVIMLLFSVLAWQGIQRDIKKIRAADRLR